MKAFSLQRLSFALLVLSACVKPNEPVLTPGQLTLSVSQIDFQERSKATLALENTGQQDLTWVIQNLADLKWVKTIEPRSSTLTGKSKIELSLTLDRAKLQSGTNTDTLTIEVNPAKTVHRVGLRAFLAAQAIVNMTSADLSQKTSTSLRAKSRLTSLGTAPIIQHGHVWATTSDPKLNEGGSLKSELNGLTKLDTFATNLTNLKPQTTYYIRAYTTTSLGVSYSETVEFTTLSELPAVKPTVSMSAGDLIEKKSTTIKVRASVSALGSSDITAYGHVWATAPDPNLADSNSQKTDFGRLGRTDSFESVVKGLEANTKYYIRAYASNKAGISYSETVGFTTLKTADDIFTVSDPLYKEQWYLKNTGQGNGIVGLDINVEPAWKQGYSGKGINVAVLDALIDDNHPDLKANLAKNTRYPLAYVPCNEQHGTPVAGIIASRANNIGTRGVAPEVKIYGHAVLFAAGSNSDVAMRNKALTADAEKIAVYSNSWGFTAGAIFDETMIELHRGIDLGTEKGFGGKGSVYVFSSGNLTPVQLGSNATLAHHAVVAVSGVDKDGAPIPFGVKSGLQHWVSGFTLDIMTSDRTDNASGKCGYNRGDTTRFSGTSAAAPMVAGVVALIREANPQLTYRDVKLILAETAKRNKLPARTTAAGELMWYETGPTYTDPNAKYYYNNYIGFGIVDAAGAVKLAQTWKNLPPQKQEEHASRGQQHALQNDVFKEIEIPVTSSTINFVEFIQLSMRFRSTQATGPTIGMYLTDPNGRELRILYERNQFGVLKKDHTRYLTGYNLYLGRHKPEGLWKLKVKFAGPDNSLTHLEDLKLKVYGH